MPVGYLVLMLFIITSCNQNRKPVSVNRETGNSRNVVYVDNTRGDDSFPGTADKPLKTIGEVNRRLANLASDICFKSGQVFKGTLYLKSLHGTSDLPVRVYSSGDAVATIDGGNGEAIHAEDCVFISIINLALKGNGRKEGNITNGLSLARCTSCNLEKISASGFQKSGIDLYDCSKSIVKGCTANDNGFSGINIMGSSVEKSKNIIIQDCKAENNPGDPAILDNHSGNGILAGVSDSILIDHCTATNNGWDMPRKGNGPVGIWAWESDHVTIQYCISYRNKTAPGAKDGGGFDLDGGVKNSVIQYCLSYENQGAGYGLFQYAGASRWSGNIVRYSISINDGQTTEGSGSIFIWNGSDDVSQLKDCAVHNNLIINTKAPLISYEKSSEHSGFLFCNNIFLGSDHPIEGNMKGSRFLGNNWHDLKNRHDFMNYPSLDKWAAATSQETMNGKFVGMDFDPQLIGPLETNLDDPYQLKNLTGFMPGPESLLRNKGIDISVMGIKMPGRDFYGNTVPSGPGTEPGIFEIK